MITVSIPRSFEEFRLLTTACGGTALFMVVANADAANAKTAEVTPEIATIIQQLKPGGETSLICFGHLYVSNALNEDGVILPHNEENDNMRTKDPRRGVL